MISLDEKVKKIVELIEDKKGQEIKIYDLQGKSPFFDYSILCTGSSSRNIDAIATDIKKGLGVVKSIDGLGECNWVLIDSGDILISVFNKDARDFYQLDEFYQRNIDKKEKEDQKQNTEG